MRIWLDPSSPPLCVYTMWMTPYLSQTKKYKCSILITLLRNGNFLNQCYGVSPISVFLLNGWVIEKNILSIKPRNKQTTSFFKKTLAQTLASNKKQRRIQREPCQTSKKELFRRFVTADVIWFLSLLIRFSPKILRTQ